MGHFEEEEDEDARHRWLLPEEDWRSSSTGANHPPVQKAPSSSMKVYSSSPINLKVLSSVQFSHEFSLVQPRQTRDTGRGIRLMIKVERS